MNPNKDIVEKILDCKAAVRIIASEFNTKKPEHELTQLINTLEENLYEIHQDHQRQTARIMELEAELATI